MREIKFRVWDKENEEFIPFNRMRFLEDGSFWYVKNDWEVMQYTGLKDKNGVEIYEGDIVECFNDGLSEVLFRKGSFGTLTYTSRGVDFYTFNEVYGTCEIIGNIYENPELLEREAE